MKAVAPDVILCHQLRRDGVPGSLLGHGVMKGSIEDCHHGDTRAECRPGGSDPLQRGLVVQGCQVADGLNGVYDLIIDNNRLHEAIPTVNHPMPYRPQPIRL
ncbi:hypothetical protein ES703_23289 [subsurface metagenome]